MDNPLEKYPEVYDYILTEETEFKTREIPLGSNWTWNMYKHIDRSFLMKNSQFWEGNNDFNGNLRPFKNIIIPIANVNYRTEGFDVKDVNLYVNSKEDFHLSLLARKFHAKWAKKYSIDSAIDESVVSDYDYGLTLVKNVNEQRPEIIQLQQLAFCDQTDILSGPICLKHNYSIDQLLDMKGKWYDDEIDRTILKAKFAKAVGDRTAETPSKYVEVYELHGMFPDSWLNEDNDDYVDEGKYSKQLHIVTYYKDQDARKGICLFKGKETKEVFKAKKRDDIYGRACGRGGIEELFHPQIWTNYSEIHLQNMLKATSKVILQTADAELAKNNRLGNLKDGQILKHKENMPLSQVVIQPLNKAAFDGYVNMWEQTARTIGSASDPALGLNPVSGTPLGTTEIVTNQGQGIHEYRQGQMATFWGEIYRDWVMDYLEKEIVKGDAWIDELTFEELQEVADTFATNHSNDRIKQIILAGGLPTPEEQETFRQTVKAQFMKGGKKRFLEIAKEEFSELPLEVEFSIAGKQKNMAEVVSKLNAIFRGIFANPAVLQQPGMATLFNDILENSGLSPIDFTSLTVPTPQPAQGQAPPQGQPPQAPQGQPSPLQPSLATSQ